MIGYLNECINWRQRQHRNGRKEKEPSEHENALMKIIFTYMKICNATILFTYILHMQYLFHSQLLVAPYYGGMILKIQSRKVFFNYESETAIICRVKYLA